MKLPCYVKVALLGKAVKGNRGRTGKVRLSAATFNFHLPYAELLRLTGDGRWARIDEANELRNLEMRDALVAGKDKRFKRRACRSDAPYNVAYTTLAWTRTR